MKKLKFTANKGDSLRVIAAGIRSEGQEIFLMSEEGKSNFEENQASGNSFVVAEYTDKTKLTDERPKWQTTIPSDGMWYLVFFPEFSSNVVFELNGDGNHLSK